MTTARFSQDDAQASQGREGLASTSTAAGSRARGEHHDVAYSDGNGEAPSYDNSKPAMPEHGNSRMERKLGEGRFYSARDARFQQQRQQMREPPRPSGQQRQTQAGLVSDSAFAFDMNMPMKPVAWHGWTSQAKLSEKKRGWVN